jgi:DNA mismatch endonuclease (patch repair protein)
MRAVSSTNTNLEMRIRAFLESEGFSVSVANNKLPGKPDILLKNPSCAVFVHGCFWHGHLACKKGTLTPKRNRDFWIQKIQYNRIKHRRVSSALRKMGLRVFVVWECRLKRPENLVALCNRIRRKSSIS